MPHFFSFIRISRLGGCLFLRYLPPVFDSSHAVCATGHPAMIVDSSRCSFHNPWLSQGSIVFKVIHIDCW